MFFTSQYRSSSINKVFLEVLNNLKRPKFIQYILKFCILNWIKLGSLPFEQGVFVEAFTYLDTDESQYSHKN